MTQDKFLKLSVSQSEWLKIENSFDSFEWTLELMGLYMAAMSKQRRGVTEDTSPDQVLAAFMHRLHEFGQKYLKEV